MEHTTIFSSFRFGGAPCPRAARPPDAPDAPARAREPHGTLLVTRRGMRSAKQLYWRYSLFVLILGLGTAIFVEIVPFIGGLLGAVTIYVLLRGQMYRLTECRRWRRSLAATLLLGEAVICFLGPLSLVVWMCVSKIQDISLDPQSIVVPLRRLAVLIRDSTGYDLWREENISLFVSQIPKLGRRVVGGILSFSVNVVVLLFVLYFMLIGGRRMEIYGRDLLPFSNSVARSVMREIRRIVRSNAIIIPLLALMQGGVAYAGYLLFKVPEPLFCGVLTGLATVIPVVGTALVWVPMAAYLGIDGHWGLAIGLLLYGVLVITQVDNVMRMVLQKKMDDTHPLVTIFGVVIGLSLFGFMGVIFGPLMLSMFIFCVRIFKAKYLDGISDRRFVALVEKKSTDDTE